MPKNSCGGSCAECPCKRTSAPGWLGAAASPEEFLNPHWYTSLPLPCHLLVDWEADNAQELAEVAPLCHGFLVMARNACKIPDNPEVAEAVRGVESDKETYFSFPHEFYDHHRRPE